MNLEQKISTIRDNSERFVLDHIARNASSSAIYPLRGDFSHFIGGDEPDLYGSADAVYVLSILGRLKELTDLHSRKLWADRLLSFQDEDGRFTRKNLRGHSWEHATAYAVGALKLLDHSQQENHIERLRPLDNLLPILTDRKIFLEWISHLDFKLSPSAIMAKRTGWHYIWRGSHVGGGIPGIFGMVQSMFEKWWPDQVNVEEWFNWYFEWLDHNANSSSGFWQLAFWNKFYKKPTIIDLGGATHFLWVYEACKRPFPFPEQIIESTISLQKKSGLYRGHPYCIDLDANFCITRSFLQLSQSKRIDLLSRVRKSVESNFISVVNTLSEDPLSEIYSDSHGLPGALAAIVECVKLPDFQYAHLLEGWQNPLDKSWWL